MGEPLRLSAKLRPYLSRPFTHGALAFALVSLTAILAMLVGAWLPLPPWPALSALGPLIIVLAVGPVNVVLAYVLYPMVENMICAIPVMIIGWFASAGISGKLVSLCVRGLGSAGYALAAAIAAAILLPSILFLAFMISIG